jgi:hypothetical protein
MAGPSVTQVAGILLVGGAALFWSIILAAIVATVRTGSLPFKDSPAVPASEFYESIAAKPRWWLAVNVTFSIGIIVAAMGLSLLGALMREAGDVVLAELGLVVFLMAAILWLVQMVFKSSMATWAADVRMRTGAVLSTAEALPRGMEQLVHTYMVLAYVATALLAPGSWPRVFLTPGRAGSPSSPGSHAQLHLRTVDSTESGGRASATS